MKQRKIGEILKGFISRKLIMSLILLIASFSLLLIKLHDNQIFTMLFKEWCWFALGVFTIYTGGNVGSKFSDKNNINGQ